MDSVNTVQLQAALACSAQKIVAAEPYLTEVDTIIGDGDHGTGMKAGFTALGKMLAGQEFDNPYDLFHSAGLCLVRSMGGASGVLFGTLFIAGLEDIKDVEALNSEQLIKFLSQGTETICRRGRTGPGDKTMIDALIPALEAMRKAADDNKAVNEVIYEGYQGALRGVEQTKNMLPRAGRSKNFREKAIGYPDPGAISISIIFSGLYEGLQ